MIPVAHPSPALPDRPTVRVVHPSGTLAPHLAPLEAGLARLEAAGCRIRWDEKRARQSWRGYLAADDDARATELIDALTEPGVDVVWFARGGSGAGRIADRVVAAARSVAPRAIVGFSDATSLLNAITTRCGWVTWHGPVLTSLAHPAIDADLKGTLATLRGDQTAIRFAPGTGRPVEGRLFGGNLTVLASTMGTSIAPVPWPDGIWLLEDIAEPPYRLDRAFCQLRSAGLLLGARGVWLGDFALDEAADAVARSVFSDDAPCPVVSGAPAGHRGPITALPIGGQGVLDPVEGTFVASAPWVERGA